MDPVTLIVAALAAGAAAGLQKTVSSAIGDAYAAVKGLIGRRYARVSLEELERKPASEAKRASVAEDLTDAGAAKDDELLQLAHRLNAAVQADAPQTGAAIGIDLKDVEAQFVRTGRISSTGTGFRGERIRLEGGMEIGDVEAGRRPDRQDP